MAEHVLPPIKFAHMADAYPRPSFFARWERARHRQAHWFVECVAETMGVFLYVYGGVGSAVPFVLGNILGQSLSSIFQIGFGFALGIVLALIICSPTSGGHFNPAVTICFVLFRKFPIKKAVRYIAAQILGSYIACLLIYVQYHHMIKAAEAMLATNGALDSMFTPQGPPGGFALYLPAGGNIGQVLVNEFVVDFVIGLTIWACLDPTNFMAPVAAGPWVVSFTYAMAIWGFVPIGISTNTARDVGSRLMALTIWGLEAGGGSYAALAALTNIPATICGALFYEFILTDSSRVITPGHAAFLSGHLAHAEHRDTVISSNTRARSSTGSSYSPGSKEQIEVIERA